MFDSTQFPLSRKGRRRLFLENLRRRNAVNDAVLQVTGAANTFRGMRSTGAIWGDCPWNELKADPGKGYTFEDDFVMTGNNLMSSASKLSIGQWSAYGDAGAFVKDGALEGGVASIGADGDQEGITLQSSTGTFRLVTTSTLALNGKLWFEAKVARSSIATAKGEFFVGLMSPSLSSNLPAVNLPITTTDDTLSTTPSFLGFHGDSTTAVRGGPTEVAVAFNLASGTVNYPTNGTTLLASTGQTVLAADVYVKLGFVFDPMGPFKRITSATARQTAGQVKRQLIRFYVNGLELPMFLTSDDVQNATAGQAFPTAFMTPVIAHMDTTASTPLVTSIDHICVAQMGSS